MTEIRWFQQSRSLLKMLLALNVMHNITIFWQWVGEWILNTWYVLWSLLQREENCTPLLNALTNTCILTNKMFKNVTYHLTTTRCQTPLKYRVPSEFYNKTSQHFFPMGRTLKTTNSPVQKWKMKMYVQSTFQAQCSTHKLIRSSGVFKGGGRGHKSVMKLLFLTWNMS